MPKRTKKRRWRICTALDGFTPENFLAEEEQCRDRDARRWKAILKETCSGKSLDEIAAEYGVKVKTLPFALWQIDTRGRYRRRYSGLNHDVIHSDVIHLSEDLTPREREEVLAHELGHFFLRHNQPRHRWMVDQDGNVEHRPYRHDEPEWESEADEFGKFLMSLSKGG